MIITKHGTDRIRERVGIKKKSADRQVKLALTRGYGIEDTNGPLNEYLRSINLRYGSEEKIIVFNSTIFIFKANKFITAWNLPNIFKKSRFFNKI